MQVLDAGTHAHAENVSRYVAGALTGAELDAFEAALFDDAELLAAVEEEQALREGMRAQSSPVVVDLPRRSSVRPAARWLPLAASFVLGAIGGAFTLMRLNSDSGGVHANVPVLLLEGSRAASTPARTFRVAADARQLVLQIPVAVNSAATPTFDLVLRDDRGTERLHVGDLRADGDEILTVVVPAATFPPGAYRADVARRDGGAETHVEFSIVR